MRADLKQEWVKRLLDDDTIQNKGSLHIERGGEHAYCCWGVLAEILYEWGEITRETLTVATGTEYFYDGGLVYPTDHIFAIAEIPWDAGDTGHIAYKLTGLNDHGSNFPYIASEIMEQL